jgi:5-methylcytosine-specific restriction endonuclease McrA
MNRAVGLIEALERRIVWDRGREIPNFDRNIWRWDAFGHVIRFSDYGDRTSPYGWEKDHIHPKALGGSDDIDNFRPLHFKNNASLGGILGSRLREI